MPTGPRLPRTPGSRGRAGRVRGAADRGPDRPALPADRTGRAGRGQAGRAARCAACWAAASAARRSCQRALRHRRRPGRPARRRRRAAGDRAPRADAAERRRRLHDADRSGPRRHLRCGSPTARCRRTSSGCGSAWATASAAWSARPATPYATANYLNDERFRHTDDIDSGVGEEGLVAILGVPLRLGSTVIGVLYAANRAERPFAREEVALLVSLAAHAAVAIDTARLLDETRSALDELSAANAAIRAHSESVERAAAAHDRMTALVLRGGGVEDVAAAVTDMFGGSLVVLDAAGRRLAGDDDHEPDGDRRRGGRVPTRGPQRAPRRSATWPPWWPAPRTSARWCSARTPRWSTPTSGSWSGPRWSPRCCCCSRRNVADAEGRVRGDLLDDLLVRPIRHEASLRARAAPARRRPRRRARPGRGRRPRTARPGSAPSRGRPPTLPAGLGWPAYARTGCCCCCRASDAGSAARAVSRDLWPRPRHPGDGGRFRSGPRAGRLRLRRSGTRTGWCRRC